LSRNIVWSCIARFGSGKWGQNGLTEQLGRDIRVIFQIGMISSRNLR